MDSGKGKGHHTHTWTTPSVGYRPFLCTICGRRFGEDAGLVMHMRTHTGEKPFHCSFPGCNRSFTASNALTIHLRTHTGEQPFVCPWPGCGRRFSEGSNMAKHYRIHSGDRPFICDPNNGCGRAFPRLDQLERHRPVCSRRNRS